jgi:hypothetical protein
MKRTAGKLYLITVSLLLVACDPAITIRQIKASNGTSTPITIEVKTEHPFAGHTWYMPQVTVTNRSDSLMSITFVDLATKRGTYANKPRQPGSYPVTVPPGETETLDIWFDLADDVKETFFDSPPSCECTIRVVVGMKPLMCQSSAGHSTPVRHESR